MFKNGKVNHILLKITIIIILMLNFGCSSDKFIAPKQSVLTSVAIKSNNKLVDPNDYKNYIHQSANSKWFGLVKMPLAIYSLSGKDSTNGFNKFLKSIGEPPVIYDSTRTNLSVNLLRTALFNRGYFQSDASYITRKKKRKTYISYYLNPGNLYFIDSFKIELKNKVYKRILKNTMKKSVIYKGIPCNANKINDERHRIVNTLRDSGFYYVNEEQFYFRVDTMRNRKVVSLTLLETPTKHKENLYTQYSIDSITVLCDINENENDLINRYIGKVSFKTKDHFFLSPKCAYNNIFFSPGETFSQTKVTNTYNNLNSLDAINYSVIRFDTLGNNSNKLNCNIVIRPSKPNTLSAEIEGTNTAGDFGAAASVSYNNKNLFRGSEMLTIKLKGAYENITGLDGYDDEDYIEFNTDVKLNFPSLLIPWLKQSYKNSLKSSSIALVSYNTQNRPEFHRRILSGTWGYSWNKFKKPLKHNLDLLSVNYIFMPWISNTFRDNYLKSDDSRYSILRYSYENLFIISSKYNFVYNSLNKLGNNSLFQTNAYQVKMGLEIAGNSLYMFSSLFNARKDDNDQYNLFDVAFSQYVKFDFDYVKSFVIDAKNSFATHLNFGIAIPYGNSTIIPYEKRYFTGGANGIRGWSVRTLGPGKYVEKDGNINFINQTGNLKMVLNLEYRTLLFKKIHGAVFIDAGNIWTTRDYTDQPQGQFHFYNFYKQIAVSYGLGLRINVDYFILRFDGGVKAVNPSYLTTRDHYPIYHPKLSRDFNFNFAVGMPF